MRRAIPCILLIALLLEASAIALDLRKPRRPRSAAAHRAEERSEMKTILMVLVLAAPALAGPGSWKAVLYGDAVLPTNRGGTCSGNAQKLDVLAHDLLTTIDAYAATDLFHADEAGSAWDTSTSWYSLEFCGSDEAVEHKWTITTVIKGAGSAETFVSLEGSAYADSLQVIQFVGDHDNCGVGQLAVDDSTGVSYSLMVPLGFSATLSKSARTQGEDSYGVKVPRATAGEGKVCRVRADASVEAAIGASCVVTNAGAWIAESTELKADLTMTGTCVYRGLKVEDTLRIEWVPASDPTATVEEPSGGVEEEDPTDIPTDTPTDDEREGEDGGPTIDAGDLPDEAPGGDAVEPDEDEEDGDGDGSPPVADEGSGDSETTPAD